MHKGCLQKKSLTFVKPLPSGDKKKKYPQNCASEDHFLITFGIFLGGFSLHFPENRGGSDPSVTNVTLFFIEGFPKDGNFFVNETLPADKCQLFKASLRQ